MKHIPIFIAFSLLIFIGAYVAIENDIVKKENRRLVNENVSLKIENVNLTKIINKADAELWDTIIVVDMAKLKVVSASFSSGKTTHTTYRFVYVGSGNK